MQTRAKLFMRISLVVAMGVYALMPPAAEAMTPGPVCSSCVTDTVCGDQELMDAACNNFCSGWVAIGCSENTTCLMREQVDCVQP